ncbi:MAG: cytochrome c [Chloroflexi bacterium]|nr:cytochrome c [Chloroflexota bacterium]
MSLVSRIWAWGLDQSLVRPTVTGLAAVSLALIFAACSTGAYPFDVFPEGHYQQSYRSQEPPRLQPPADSVPIGGKEVAYTFVEAGDLTNPLQRTPETMAKAAEIYRVNCLVCHGAAGRGDGPAAAYFRKAGVSEPTDYTTQRVRSRKDGELYWIVTYGLGFMPRFGPLLTPEERWAVIHFVRVVSAPGQ